MRKYPYYRVGGKKWDYFQKFVTHIRRTGRILIARPRLHSMQRGKNGCAKDIKQETHQEMR